jgi:hypothetical protein
MELADSIETGDRHVHIHEFPTSRTQLFRRRDQEQRRQGAAIVTPISQPRLKWSVSRVVHPLQE